MDDTSSGITIILPHVLREKVGNRKSVMITGCANRTIREVIGALDEAYPGMKFHICYETGEIRPYVNLFLNRENIRFLQGLDTPVADGATLHILQSVAGGNF